MCIQYSLRQECLDGLPDYTLMEKACAGNELAFEVLIKRYQEPLYRFASHRVDSELARDVMQFVWLQLYMTLPTLLQKPMLTQDNASLKSWLFCITRNRCIDEMRRVYRNANLFCELYSTHEEDTSPLGQLLDDAPSPEELAEQHDEQARLLSAIESLPPKYRTIVWLRYTQDLSFAEIGGKLHMPANTVKTYFHRARPQLCAALNAKLSA